MIPFSYHGYAMLVIGLLELGLLWFVLTKYQRSTSIRWFAVVVGSVATFVLVNAVTYLDQDVHVAVHLSQWFIGVVITMAFYMFVRQFPFPSEKPSSNDRVLFWTPITFFFVLIFFSGQFITGLDYSYLPARQLYGPVAIIFAFFFLIFWMLIVAEIIRKIRKSDGIHRWQLRTFLFGAVLPSLILVTLFDVIFPLAGIFRHYWLGIEATIIWLGFTVYIISKR